jgi:hypothetical protein
MPHPVGRVIGVVPISHTTLLARTNSLCVAKSELPSPESDLPSPDETSCAVEQINS